MKRILRRRITAFSCTIIFLTVLFLAFTCHPHQKTHADTYGMVCPNCSSTSFSVLSVYAPTCDSYPLTTYICNDCSFTWETEAATVRGHIFTHTTIPATCTEDGSDVAVCTDCGYTTTAVIPATGHSFPDEWTVERAATADAPGLESRTCTVCGEKEEREIAKLDTGTTDAPTQGPTNVPGEVTPTGSDATPTPDDPGNEPDTATPTVTVAPTPTKTPTQTPTSTPKPTEPGVTTDITGSGDGTLDTTQEGGGLAGNDTSVTGTPAVTPSESPDETALATPVPGADPSGNGEETPIFGPSKGENADPDTPGSKDPTELIDIDDDRTPGAPAIIAIIVGVVGVATIVTVTTLRGKKAKKLRQNDPGDDGLDKPDLEDQTIVTYLKNSPRAEQLCKALDKRPFLLVKQADTDIEALTKLVKDEKPKLILIDAALAGDIEAFRELETKLSEACDDSGFALIFEGRDHASTFGADSLKADKKFKDYSFYTSSDDAIITKLILPIYKPDFSMDNILDGIGNIAEAFGIPALSTITKVLQVGGNVKEAIAEKKLDKEGLGEMLGNIADIFGFDLVGDIADAASFAGYEKEKHFSKDEDDK